MSSPEEVRGRIKVTIRENQWTQRELRDARGCMCVLGHVALACGIPAERLRGWAVYTELPIDEQAKLPETLRPSPQITDVLWDIMFLNDGPVSGSTRLTQERKERLTKALAFQGVDLEWVAPAAHSAM